MDVLTIMDILNEDNQSHAIELMCPVNNHIILRLPWYPSEYIRIISTVPRTLYSLNLGAQPKYRVPGS